MKNAKAFTKFSPVRSNGQTWTFDEHFTRTSFCPVDRRCFEVKKKKRSGRKEKDERTFVSGFGDRLLAELKRLAPKEVKIKISAPRERLYSTWIG